MIVSNQDEGVINVGLKASREDEENFAEAALGWKFINGSPTNNYDIDLLQVDDGKRAVGLYALLRENASSSIVIGGGIGGLSGLSGLDFGGSSNDDSALTSNENMIMALGFVVFDEVNPRC